MEYKSFKKLGPAIKLDILSSPEGITDVNLSYNQNPFCEWTIKGPCDLDNVESWIKAYLVQKPLTKLPKMVWPATATPFFLEAWKELAKVPFGSNVTYKGLGELIGHPIAFRAIGTACGKNPFPFFVPCHRVLGASGKLGGFSCGLNIKKRLLQFEGIKFI